MNYKNFSIYWLRRQYKVTRYIDNTM